MEGPTPEDRVTTGAPMTKASVVRGYAKVLEREGKLAAVLAKVPPGTRELLANPPASSAWVSVADMEPIMLALESMGGLAECRRLGAESLRVSLVPLITTFLQGMLRLFGASPETLLSRLNETMKLTNRGVDSSYTRKSPRAGTLRIAYPSSRDIPVASFHAIMGSIDVIYELCGAAGTGTVAEPRIVPNGKSNAADFDVAW